MNRGNCRCWDTRNVYRILVGKSYRKRLCSRSRFRVKYNVGWILNKWVMGYTIFLICLKIRFGQ
jgi:hypothetical protein